MKNHYKYNETLLDAKTIIGLIVGFVVSLIFFVVAPMTLPNESKTYIIIIAFAGLLSILYLLNIIYKLIRRLNFYFEYKSIYQNYPIYLKIEKYNRKVIILENGDAKFIYKYSLRNLGKDSINMHPETVRYDGCFRNLEVKVNNEYIQKESLKEETKPCIGFPNMNETRFYIPFDSLNANALEQDDEVDIELSYEIEKVFEELLRNEATGYGTPIVIPCNELNINIQIPNNYKIIRSRYERALINVTDKGYCVSEITRPFVLESEMIRLNENNQKPQWNRKGIVWNVKNPKVGFYYTLSFKIEPIIKK